MENVIWKESFSVIFEILRPFFNTLTSDGNYFPGISENLPQPTQMKLSVKLKIFSELLTAFVKYIFTFKHFENKDEPDSLCFSEIIDRKIRSYVNV